MKKLLVLVLALVLCLGLCACDVEAVLDGVGDVLDREEKRSEQAVDQMVPANGSSFGEGTAYIVVDEDGNIITDVDGSEIEVIDGVLYIDGEEAGEFEVEVGEDGIYSFISGIEE